MPQTASKQPPCLKNLIPLKTSVLFFDWFHLRGQRGAMRGLGCLTERSKLRRRGKD
ncbi:hypothetical protein NC653_005572 [Populus alba x Populus x berolinensis]|uniref:Uncharacterized protein n=1 Tax=Populus alba x Populus x berolinensis TaxID=444605 RepID=A0AAD6RC71_9ROSI|nr:hypothetical protein NC653_005572 [Populus alba x Populus x berolinensis]